VKLIKVLCTLMGLCWFIAWIRHDYPFPVRAALPFLDGPRPIIYDLAQLVMLGWAAIAAKHLVRR
jgi:hypothetical protein